MKNKKAFTLAELLIAFVIIGIISTFAVYTVQKYDKGIRFLYANTYHNLDRALYNAFYFSDIKSPFSDTELNDSGSIVNVSPELGAERLCQMLVKYLNTTTTSCSQGNLAQQDGVTFGSVKFQTLNGANYYISKRLPTNPSPGDHTFFLIYVDINSDARPNSMDYEPPSASNNYKPKDPDVFAFAALDIGRICPLGPPEIDPRYMQSRIAYITQQGDDETLTTKYSVVSKPYYLSKAEAWGYYLGGDDSQVLDEEPISYNDYIRSKLPANTKIYSFLNGASISAPEGVHLQSNPVGSGGFGCRSFSPEECWVIVDKYLY